MKEFELAGVSRTALLMLKARADEHQKRERRFADPWAVEWLRVLGWPRDLRRVYSRWVQGRIAIRAAQIDDVVRRCVARFEIDTIVELGCGLSSRRQRLALGEGVSWIDLDLPPVIEVRESLGIRGKGHRHLARSVLDLVWMDDVMVSTREGASRTLFVAEGLVYYLAREDASRLLMELRRRFFGAISVFDVIGMLDLGVTAGFYRRLDVPVHWAIRPTFETALAGFGLSMIEGFEPDVMLEDAIGRAGAWARPLLTAMASIDALRARRSGTLVGRLKPL